MILRPKSHAEEVALFRSEIVGALAPAAMAHLPLMEQVFVGAQTG